MSKGWRSSDRDPTKVCLTLQSYTHAIPTIKVLRELFPISLKDAAEILHSGDVEIDISRSKANRAMKELTKIGAEARILKAGR